MNFYLCNWLNYCYQDFRNALYMKWIAAFAISLFCFSFAAQAQKFAYVDTDYILSNMPEYSAAKKQLDDISVKWQKEIEEKFGEVDKMYRDFQVEKILMSEEMKIEREAEILAKENEAKALQKKRFGQNGDLFTKQQELIKPIQDKVYSAIVEISETKGYGMVFDKAGSTTVIYSQPRYDISDDIIKQMGYTPGQDVDPDDDEDEDYEEEDDGSGSSDDKIKADPR